MALIRRYGGASDTQAYGGAGGYAVLDCEGYAVWRHGLRDIPSRYVTRNLSVRVCACACVCACLRLYAVLDCETLCDSSNLTDNVSIDCVESVSRGL